MAIQIGVATLSGMGPYLTSGGLHILQPDLAMMGGMKPCLAAARWRKLSDEQAAVADRLEEHLARLRYRYPESDCVVLASPQAP